jgi:hypothetical protein
LEDILISNSSRIKPIKDHMKVLSDTSAWSMIEVRRDVVAWSPSHLIRLRQTRAAEQKLKTLVMLAAKQVARKTM